jgi:hypothetical protein
MAKTGYGKRSAGDEDPHAEADFAHLSPRDRDIAVFIDHLEDGHAMGYKAIAAAHPRYGQQATRVSMKSLTGIGHLRHIREHLQIEDNSMRWVTRTYWSRMARTPEWWVEFVRERKGRDVTAHYMSGLARVEEAPEEPCEAPEAEAAQAAESAEAADPRPSAAYETLAGLRAADPRLPLSHSDCRSLEALAEEWLSRGATPHDITRALTEGLPSAVNNPGGLARRRLEDKMPPKKAKVRQIAGRRARVSRVILACVTCDADERTEKIIDGLCGECREELEQDLAQEQAEGPPPGYIPDTFFARPFGGPGYPG